MRQIVKVEFDNGNTIETEINGTQESIREYYAIGCQFNVGSVDDKMAYVAKVTFPDATPPEKHKHYEQARRAYTNTSFSPEKRALSECAYFDATIAELQAIGCSAEGLAKFETLFLKLLAAKSRCASSMITGPAGFNNRRNEKANNVEHKRSLELTDYVERVKKAIDKEKNPHKYAISSDAPEALQMLKDKLAKLVEAQETMKLANKIIKDKALLKVERLTEVFGSKEAAESIMKPDCFGGIGFASFSLTNNNATIKATESRIKQLEAAAGRVTRELVIAGVRVVENAEENRIQFYFDGKPAADVITLMKSHGFKWSPSQGCWQRLWNGNAIWTVNHYVIPALKAKQVEAA